jgi:YHS domain-containing protein
MMFRSLLRRAVSRNNKVNIWSIAVLLILVSFLVSCSKNSDLSADTNPESNAINGYDPVAYFTESKPVPGNENFFYVRNSSKWFFSSKDNMELFMKNPAQYMPQYNGYCAFALRRNDYINGNPAAWAIVDEKLYLTYNLNIKNAWLQDKEYYISKADSNWKNNKLSKN